MDVHAAGLRPVDWGLGQGLGVPRFAAHRFTASSLSLSGARRFTHETLTSWGLERCADDATLVAAELMTNAATHALAAESDEEAAAAWLGLSCTDRTVTCTVSDPSDQRPRTTTQDPLAEGGRGLRIVTALSDDWGCDVHADGTGKAVWAHLQA
ncbi:ATP-binding protein [Streptomyces sp. NPDC004435]|uniref:ATP-binding protein n=1 Tax=Streptomyces sp. NPDC004435 TaxID=3364701 RepID=UPI0036AEC6A2